MYESLVSTIETEVKKGKYVQEILSLVKENVLAEFQIEGLEQPIKKITNFICNTKHITEETILETTQKYTIKCEADAILLPLIMAIELSSIQYQEVTSDSTVKDKDAQEDIPKLEDGARSTNVEEGNVVTIESRQGVSSCRGISESKVDADRVPATQTISQMQETQVKQFDVNICLKL